MFLIFGCFFISVFFYVNNYENIKLKSHKEYLSNNFGITVANRIDNGKYIIYGNLYNKTKKKYSNVKVIFVAYDEFGNKINTCYETFDNYYETREFEIDCGYEEGIGYYLLEDVLYQ